MLETAMGAMTGLGVGGAMKSYKAEKAAGRAEAAGYALRAKTLKEEGKATIEKGLEEQRIIKERAKRLLATQKAIAAAQGGAFTGSNIAILADTAAQAEWDASMTMRNYELEAQGLYQQAGYQQLYGKLAKRTANIRAMTGLFGDMFNIGQMYIPYLASKTPKTTVKRWSPNKLKPSDIGQFGPKGSGLIMGSFPSRAYA
jgi:hypothetical protein